MGKSLTGLALGSHGSAVQSGSSVTGSTGGVDQDSGDGAGVEAAAVDTEQQRKSLIEGEVKGYGGEKSNCSSSSKTGSGYDASCGVERRVNGKIGG